MPITTCYDYFKGGTLFEDFSRPIGDWTVTTHATGAAAVTNTAAYLREGSAGLMLTTPTPGSSPNYVRVRRTVPGLALTGNERWMLMYHVVSNPNDNAAFIALHWYNSDRSSFRSRTLDNPIGSSYSGGHVLGPRSILWPNHDHFVFASPVMAWSAATELQIQVDNSGGSGPCVLVLDALYQAPRTYLPRVIFTFDDGYASWYNYAKPIFDTNGWKGTLFIGATRVAAGNGTTNLSQAQLVSFISAGWDIQNHCNNEELLDGLSYAQAVTTLRGCESYLAGLGVNRDLKICAYPGGAFSSETKQIMLDEGFTAGRTAREAPYSYLGSLRANFDAYELPILEADAARSASTFLGLLDTNLKQGQSTIVMLHDFPVSGATGVEVNQSVATDIFSGIRIREKQGLCVIDTLKGFFEGPMSPSVTSRPTRL